MSVFAIVGFGLLGLAVVITLIGISSIVVRSLRLRARINSLVNHHTLIAVQRASHLSERTADWPERIAAISARVEKITVNVGALLAVSAVLRAEVGQIGRTTENVLDTFVPALRGSL